MGFSAKEPGSKTIIYVRHSTKDGPNISEAGYALIKEKAQGIIGNNDITKGFYSSQIRTKQTLDHLFETGNVHNATTHQIDGLWPMPIEADFKGPKAEQFNEAYKATHGEAIKSLERVFPERIEEYQRLCAEGVMQCFSQMEPGEIAVAIGHTPYVQYAAHHLSDGAVELTELSEMEFMTFVQHEDNTISVII